MNYYDELAPSADPARRVGWKRRIGQAYRYELVAQNLGPHAPETSPAATGAATSIVDVGSGEAGLCHYLRQRGDAVDYLGIEKRRVTPAVDCPVIHASFDEVPPPPCDLVVALGTLVGEAEDHPSEASAHRRARALLEWMVDTGARAGILVAIDIDALEKRSWLGDPALAGVRAPWFQNDRFQNDRFQDDWFEDDRFQNDRFQHNRWQVVPVSQFEVAVGWGTSFALEEALDAAYDGPFGPFDPAEGAWLAHEIGLVARARDFLGRDVGDAALARLVEARLDEFDAG